MTVVVILIFVIMLICLIAAYFIPLYLAGRRHSKEMDNRSYYSDGAFVTYTYKISSTKEEVIECLSHRNVNDRLYYEFDRYTLQIRFANPEVQYYGIKDIGVAYQLRFEEKDHVRLLRVEQIERNLSKNASLVAGLMNVFWTEKIGAKCYDG